MVNHKRLFMSASILSLALSGCTVEYVCDDDQQLCELSDDLQSDLEEGIADEVADQAGVDNSFTCDDGETIKLTQVCNDEEDCSDGEDEVGCE